ncbi:MAG: toprim domain-containing protein [Alphaproteobacteria bacterium]|nr:toprim domain-containing protein [Alphaproteobacteria bacterium]
MTAGRPVLMDIGELVARLAARAPALARDLLPAGVRRGNEWCVAGTGSPCGCSISVHLAGSKAGIWGAWAAGKSGDALDLVTNFADLSRYRSEQDRSDKAAAIRWGRAWLGLDAGAPPAAAPPARALARQAEPSAEDKRRAAWRWWIAGTPLRPDDDAWDYLVETRGIDLAALPRRPGALRYVRGLPNAEAGRPFPAMLAAVTGPGGRFQTIHRTWLERQSTGRVLKAPVAAPKKVYSACKGGTIRLARGASGKPWAEAPEGDVLGLTEGIENGLSYAVAVPEHRVAAALNVGNLPHLRLPAAISTVIIAADSDAPGSPADRTLRRAVDRFLGEGREVRIARVPAGFKDFNEYLLAETG